MKADEEIIINVKAEADVDTKPIERKLKRISREFQQLAKDMAKAQKIISPATVGADYDEMSKKIDELQALFTKLSDVAKDTTKKMKELAKAYNTTNSVKERKKLAKQIKEEMKLVRELESVMRGYRKEAKDVYDSLNLPRGPPPKEKIPKTTKRKDVTLNKELDVMYDTLRQSKATRMGSQLTMYTAAGIEKVLAPLDKLFYAKGKENPIAMFYSGVRGGIVGMGAEGSLLMAKIGVIGVILKKVYEVMEKMVRYSGVMQASLKLLTFIVQMSIKPVADVIGGMMLPILMLVMKALMPLFKNWNKIMAHWMKSTKNNEELTMVQLLSTLMGMKTGGLMGGFAGAILPMFAEYARTGTDETLRVKAAFLASATALYELNKAVEFLATKGMLVFGGSLITSAKVVGVFSKIVSFSGVIVTKIISATATVFGGLTSVVSATTVGLVGLIAVLTAVGYYLGKFVDEKIKVRFGEGTIGKMLSSFVKSIFPAYGGISALSDLFGAIKDKLSPVVNEALNKSNEANETISGAGVALGSFTTFLNSLTVLGDKVDNLITAAIGLGGEYDELSTELDELSALYEGTTLPKDSRDLLTNIELPIDKSKNFWESNGGKIKDKSVDLFNAITKKIDEATQYVTAIKPASPFIPSQYTETIQSYDIGGLVRETGLALVHEGEYVIPRNMVDKLRDVIHNPSPIAPIVPKPIFGVPEPIYRPEGSVINVNVNVERVASDIDLDWLAREIAERTMREIEMRGGM